MKNIISVALKGSILILFAGVLLAGTTKEERTVGDFKSIKLSGSGEVFLVQGPENKLVVEADKDDLEQIETYIKGSTLVLKQKDRFFGRVGDVTYYVTAKELNAVSISGSGKIESDKISSDDFELNISGSGDIAIKDLNVDKLDLYISGSGEVELAGRATQQTVKISGSGDYNAKNLIGEYVKVNISGSGSAEVNAATDLTINTSGSSDVVYYGTPRVTSSANGQRKVRQGGDSSP